MTTADDTPEQTQSEDSPTTTNKSTKKRKSPGFIETSSFKPSWLETGPLTPDMLPPELMAQVVEEASTQDSISDDLLAQIAELERLYNESEQAEALAESAAVDSESVDTVDTEESDEHLVAETQEVEPETTEVALETDSEIEPDSERAYIESQAAFLNEILESDDETNEIEFSDIEPASLVFAESIEVDPVPPTIDEPTVPPNFDDFIVDDDLPEAETIVAATAVAAPKAKPARKSKPKRQHPLFDGLARTLLLLGLILLGLAALTYFVNPFARIALSTAELARPVASPVITNPAGAETDWCVSGNFLADGEPPLRMHDGGGQGDIVAGDQVFALQTNTIEPGTYQWQVVGCELGDLAYPESRSWLQVDAANQPVTFMFDSQEREDALFFPIPFAVSALDSAANFQVVGSFQDWNPDDASAILQHQGGGIYQQVRRIARPGIYEAYVISGNRTQAIDAYGRTVEPIPFSFETSRSSEAVVFLLDTNRGRASVLYGMPWIATQLAYGAGYRVLSFLLGLSGLLLLMWMLIRMIMMGSKDNWLEAGCPQCGRQELMRINRQTLDRLLNVFGIPAYRYQCRHCTWTGNRLSEDGAAVSPGATTIMADPVR